RRLLSMKRDPARAIPLDVGEEGVHVVMAAKPSIAARRDRLRQVGQSHPELKDAVVRRRKERLTRNSCSIEIAPEQVSRAGVVMTDRRRGRSGCRAADHETKV